MTVLESLLEALPTVSEPPSLVEPPPQGVSYVTSERPEFVEPPLAILSGQLAQAQVAVVSAPAAVGKSMLAEHLARRTGGALWNLAGFHVGNNFAVGTLAEAHGSAALSDVIGRLRSGSFLIVADALDEARLRVSFDAFVAFLEDVARQLVAPPVSGRPSLVLLARGETADFATDWLREAGAEVATLGIEFFDRPEALAFVDRQIAARGEDPSREAMVRARNSMFDQTLALLGVEDDEWPLDPARRFLGYAPVLVALGRHLAQGGNPQRLAQQMAVEGTPEAMWRFLASLVRAILEREQGKFTDGFRGMVGSRAGAAGFSDWGSLFTPREQCSWLLNEALGTPPPPVPVPQELEDDYRSEVRNWLSNHVLVGASAGRFASPVFEEYAYAQVLVDGEPSERSAVRARVAGASYRPAEMLARFVFALGESSPTVHPADLPALYESLSAGEEAGRPAELELTDDEGLRGGVTVRGDRVDIEFSTNNEPLVFTRRLGRASIQLEHHGVRLGVSGRPFEIGPDVTVRAAAVEVTAESLLVHEGDEGTGDVVLLGESVTATDPAFRIVRGGERLKVRADPPLQWQFAPHAIPPGPPPVGPEEQRAATALFRLMAHFKSEGYGGLGSYPGSIDRRAGRDSTFGRLLAFARQRGLVTEERGIYKLHPEVVGLDYLSVQAQVLSDEAAEFVRDFVSEG